MKTPIFKKQYALIVTAIVALISIGLVVINGNHKKESEFGKAMVDLYSTPENFFVKADHSTSLPYQYVIEVLYHNDNVSEGTFQSLLDTLGSAAIHQLAEELVWSKEDEQNSIKAYRTHLSQEIDSFYQSFLQAEFSDKVKSFNARISDNNRLIAKATKPVFESYAVLESKIGLPRGNGLKAGAKVSKKGANLIKAAKVTSKWSGPVDEFLCIFLDVESKPLIQLLFEHGAAHTYSESLRYSKTCMLHF